MNASPTQHGDPSEPNRSFADARLKVQWAQLHIQRVDKLTTWFLDKQQEAGFVREDPATGEYVIGGQVPPADISLAAGDAIFSLRSALDCCWMGLKRASGIVSKVKTLPRAFTRQEVVGTIGSTGIEGAFKGVTDLIADQIRPYRDGNEVLWFAAQVDNWNKHNMLIAAAHGIGLGEVTIRHKVTDGILILDGAQLVGTNLIGIGRGPFEIEVDSSVTMEIMLLSRVPVDEWPLLPFLKSLHTETSRAVDIFAAFVKS